MKKAYAFRQEPVDSSFIVKMMFAAHATLTLIQGVYVACQVPTFDEDKDAAVAELLRSIGGIKYNYFDGKKVAAALAARLKGIFNIRFGREYSPVLYVVPAVEADMTQESLDRLIDEFKSMGKELGADEIDTTPRPGCGTSRQLTSAEIRLWWE